MMACHAFQKSYCCCLTTSAQLPWFRLKKMANVQAFGYWATLHLMRCCHPITVWFGSVTKQNRNRLQCTLSSTENLLFSIQDLYRFRQSQEPGSSPCCRSLMQTVGTLQSSVGQNHKIQISFSPPVHPALLCNIALSNVYVNMYIDLSIFTAFPFLCMSRTERQVTNYNQVCFRYAIKLDSVCKSLHLSEQPLCCNMFKAFFSPTTTDSPVWTM